MSPKVTALLTCFVVSAALACNKSSPSASSSGETTTGGSAATATATATASPTTPATAAAPAANAKIYATRGVIKAFGEGRKSLKIAHEDVPGYMKAMTMPFAVTSPNVLDGLKEGDAVDFSFTEESDGRLLIQTIKKR